MVVNEVEVICPECGHPAADFLGFYTFQNGDDEIKQNHYQCLGCKQPFLKERTDKNLHPEFIKKK